ncbi:glycosyltransferase family 2 protein [Roseovarius sp.]|uniref:glycosyltransferase family 2 protein n=1 Tax=Roseovarius sp. TaxID=1486281 RepID=UPI002622C671|nr:glycosyltransferase family 2 protein [Roseovarius sp.]MDM8164545.1 glycosyltransferase family 2 protein [Roseovarius sp.]
MASEPPSPQGTPAPKATVIIPANNEEAYIGACLDRLAASAGDTPFETIVVANACSDRTVEIARQVADLSTNPARPVHIIDTDKGGKLGALQLGDDAARAPIRIYLDADVTVSPALIPALIATLDTGAPRYASGTPEIAPAQSPVTRAYARFWQKLPFVTTGVPGFGIFAVNGPGRARWETWPEIISDDTFARLNFSPEERVRLPQTYRWPMIEGLSGLIRVRRRQDRGVREIGEKFPRLLKNADPSTASRTGKLNAILRDPLGFLVYGFIALCVRLPGGKGDWARGR